MSVRTFTAAAALAAAVSVSGCVVVVCRARGRRLRRAATSERLMAGCEGRDNVALRGQLAVFQARMEREWAREAALAEAGRVLEDALARTASRVDPMEGGSK